MWRSVLSPRLFISWVSVLRWHCTLMYSLPELKIQRRTCTFSPVSKATNTPSVKRQRQRQGHIMLVYGDALKIDPPPPNHFQALQYISIGSNLTMTLDARCIYTLNVISYFSTSITFVLNKQTSCQLQFENLLCTNRTCIKLDTCIFRFILIYDADYFTFEQKKKVIFVQPIRNAAIPNLFMSSVEI